MPHPHPTTHSAIRTSAHRSPLSAPELIARVEHAIETSAALNHCFAIIRSHDKISIQNLNQAGEILIKHHTGCSFNFVSFEYRSADFTFVRRLKQELSASLQLSEPIKGSLAEPKMFESLGKFIQFIPKFFVNKLSVTESAIESARQCEFDNYEGIIPELEAFLKIRDIIAGKSWEPEITPEQIENYQKVHQDGRLILHRGKKLYLTQYLKVASHNDRMDLRIYFKWEPQFKKHLIGGVELARPS